MKKYIVISIIAVVALLPFAAWAHTGGTAEATLTFEAVINMTVDGEAWLDLTIDQPMIAIMAAGGFTEPMNWDDPDDDITVTVQSFTAFRVYSSYFATSTGLNLPTDLIQRDTFLYLDSYALQWEQVLSAPAGGGAFNYSAPPATSELTELNDWGDPGPANMFSTSPGDSRDYNVKWDPTQLSGANLNAGDTMEVIIYFVVTDSSL
jgi:hypothetical protein